MRIVKEQTVRQQTLWFVTSISDHALRLFRYCPFLKPDASSHRFPTFLLRTPKFCDFCAAVLTHRHSIMCAYAHNFSDRAHSPDLSRSLLLSTAPRLASRRLILPRHNSRTRKMLHELLQTSTRFSDASDSAKYARHAPTMRIIGPLAHQCHRCAQRTALFADLAVRERAERCCDRCQAAQASLRKFRPGRSAHVGRLTSFPSDRLTATRRGARGGTSKHCTFSLG